MFSTGFNSWFGTWGFGYSGWNNQTTNVSNKAPTKQEKFPWLNAQQIANIEKVTANLTWAEKSQEQQKLYQAMIQAIEAENFNDNRMAANNERYKNSLSKTDPKECKFDQSACRQSTLVDMVKSARNLKANTPEDTVMQMFMQEMDYKWISMDKLNSYLDNGDETILYEAWLKTNLWGTKDLVNQAWSPLRKSWSEKNLMEKGETITNYTNIIWYGTEELDEEANKFADKWLNWGTKIAEHETENLKEKVENMSKEEVEAYRKQYEELLKDKDWRVATVEWSNPFVQTWNLIKWNKKFEYDDENFMKWLISQKASATEWLSWADEMLTWDISPSVIQFFGNIPSSALKTFTATIRGMTNPYDTMKWLYILAKDVIDNWFENSAIGQRYGSWDGFTKALNEDPVWVADDALAVAEILLKPFGGNVWSVNDVLAQKAVWNMYWFMDNASKYGDTWLSKVTNWAYNWEAIQKLNNVVQAESDLGKMAQEWKNLYESIKNSNFVDEMINKMVGIDKEDRTFIKENKDLVNDYISGKKNVETAYQEVSEKLSDKALEKTEMWKEYDKLAQNTEKVVNTEWITNDKDLQKLLKKWKITIDADDNLVFDKLSEYNATQQKAIQDAWETLKAVEEAKNIDAWTALDQRRKIDDKINWEWKATDKSKVDMDAEDLIKQMRRSVDARAKQYVPWLEELDTKYQPLIDEVRQMKKDWFNSDWTMKDNARSKIRNLTKAWNEARLERLEKIAPWIKQDLKALDAALTVDKLTKNSVWQYYKWWGIALGIKSLFSGNIPAALGFTAIGILATPKNFVKLIEREPAIASKLMNWDTLTSADISRLQAIASRLEDGMDVEEK